MPDRRIQSVDGPPILQNIPDPSGGCITLNMVTANKFEKDTSGDGDSIVPRNHLQE